MTEEITILNYFSNKTGKEVVDYSTDWYAGCSTCDFGTGVIHLKFADGTTMETDAQFGTLINDVIEYAEDALKKGRDDYWLDNLDRLF